MTTPNDQPLDNTLPNPANRNPAFEFGTRITPEPGGVRVVAFVPLNILYEMVRMSSAHEAGIKSAQEGP